MSLIKSLYSVFRNQFNNLTKIFQGRPLTIHSLNATTLDMDDVHLARRWLKDSRFWYRLDEVEQYHTQFATWNGSAHAFSFMGGRVALSAIIHALELKSGDEVIIPGYTCVVVPNAFHYAGVRVVFSDIELETYGLDVSQIESKITLRTKAILLHHLYGLVCRDYEAILGLAKRHNLKIIEDCALAAGAEYRGVKVGNYGDAAFYSSQVSKVFNTVQGGIAVTNDPYIARGLKEYYDQASYPDKDWINKLLHNVILKYYQFKHPQRWWRQDWVNLRYGDKQLLPVTEEEKRGVQPARYMRKMPAPVAALGVNQLEKLDDYNSRRRQTAKKWDCWCEENGYKKPLVIDGSVPIYLRYPILVEAEKKRDRSWAVEELGVQVGVWFVSNIHPVHRAVTGCPNADKAVRQCINFPTIIC